MVNWQELIAQRFVYVKNIPPDDNPRSLSYAIMVPSLFMTANPLQDRVFDVALYQIKLAVMFPSGVIAFIGPQGLFR